MSDGCQDRHPDVMHLLTPVVFPKVAAGLIAAIALSVATAFPPTRPLPQQSSPRAGSSTVTGLTAVSGSTSVPPGRAAAPTVTTTTTTTAGRRPGGSRLPFTWPMSPRPAVHRLFEPPTTQWSRGHRGVDLLARVGQPVLSAGQGVVAFSGVVAGRGVITIRHAGEMRTTYEPVDARMPAGALVGRGATIAVVSAMAGHCVPLTCLHWGAISGQAYLDPLSLLGLGQPVLLPLG